MENYPLITTLINPCIINSCKQGIQATQIPSQKTHTMSYSTEQRSGLFTYLKDLDDRKNEWSICVRAVRVYDVQNRDGRGNTMEIIFHDKLGTRIHAQVKRPELKKFKPLIKEGSVCALRNFTVNENYHTFKTTDHPYILGFYKDTLWFDLSDYPFPCYMYNMCPFEKLLLPLEQNILTDVIGKVVGMTQIQNRMAQGCPIKTLVLTLEDERGQHLRCTLWGEYVQKFNKAVGAGITDPVLIVQFCRAKEIMKEVSISTSFHVTKLILSNDSYEAKEFMKLAKCSDNDSRSTSSFTLTQGSEVTELRSTVRDINISTIRSLLNETEDGYYWVAADVVSIDYKDWNYLGCTTKNCNRKVEQEGEEFRCSACAKTIPAGEYKYKVTVLLKDESGNANFVLWDKECKEFMGIPASKLRDTMLERTGDARDFPEELEEAVLSKNGLFKTVLRNASQYVRYRRTRTFGVLTMITDPEIVALYNPQSQKKQDKDGWADFNFAELLNEKIETNDEENIKKPHGKHIIADYNGGYEEGEASMDMGSATKSKKKPRIGMVEEDGSFGV